MDGWASKQSVPFLFSAAKSNLMKKMKIRDEHLSSTPRKRMCDVAAHTQRVTSKCPG